MQILQTTLLYIVPFVLVLGMVVTIHELGHFLAAKWLGTKIDRFSLGFGRPIAAWTDKSGVEWRLGWAAHRRLCALRRRRERRQHS